MGIGIRSPVGQRDSVHLFCGTSRGGKTLDQGEGGGNPFASALIELLARQELTLGSLAEDIIPLTERKSGGFQSPETPTFGSAGATVRLRASTWGTRPALVLVVADYASGGAPSLPGAAHDAVRVAAALKTAGFQTTTVIDPTKAFVSAVLDEFAISSAAAEMSAIYTTGHGVELDGTVYLLPGDYPISKGNAELPERAIRLSDFAKRMRGRTTNLLFYAGCRDAPFG